MEKFFLSLEFRVEVIVQGKSEPDFVEMNKAEFRAMILTS